MSPTRRSFLKALAALPLVCGEPVGSAAAFSPEPASADPKETRYRCCCDDVIIPSILLTTPAGCSRSIWFNDDLESIDIPAITVS